MAAVESCIEEGELRNHWQFQHHANGGVELPTLGYTLSLPSRHLVSCLKLITQKQLTTKQHGKPSI